MNSTGVNIRHMLRRIIRLDEFGVTAGLVVICIGISLFSDKFMLPANLLTVIRQASQVGMMALGMVFVISMGDIDLSVGSIYNLVLIVAAYSMADNGLKLNVWAAVLIGLAVGALCGFINGALSIVFNIPTIVVTLGTMSIFKGIGLVICKASPITEFPLDNFFFTTLGNNIGPIPSGIVIWVVLGIILYLLYNHSPFGRRICAIGSNLLAARFSGVRVTQTRLLGMTLMGAISGIAGLYALAFLQASDPNLGSGYELFAIASAIIGGAALAGGKGSIIGAFIGALIIAVIRNGVVLLGISFYWNATVTGSVIILAVALDYFIKRRNKVV